MQVKPKNHTNSKDHSTNMLSSSYLGTTNIASQMGSGYRLAIARHDEKANENKGFLSKIVDYIKFCGKHKLPLRGYDEIAKSKHPGVFRDLVAFACELDACLNAHIASNSAFKYSSKATQNKILVSVLCVSKEIIKDEIAQLDYLAIVSDETTDIYDEIQIVIVARFEFEGKPIERFWIFLIRQT